MKIPEDEIIRLAFEEQAFQTCDPDFRKDEVWQKIQMRLNSTNNKSQNRYIATALILLFFTLTGWMITFQYSQLRKIPLINPGEKLEKKISMPPSTRTENLTSTIPKIAGKRMFYWDKGSPKHVMQIKTEGVSKPLMCRDTIKKTASNVIMAELHSDEPTQKISSTDRNIQGFEEQENYIFSFRRNHQQIMAADEVSTRRLKIQLFTQEPLKMNSGEMGGAGLLYANE